MSYPKTIAVDFDGCLCTRKWPDIGEPNWKAINKLIARQAEGYKLILWTCREGKQLEEAVAWCRNHYLRFDAVNECLPEHKEYFGNDTRKVYADEYWDDKAVRVVAEDDCQVFPGQIVCIPNAHAQKTLFQKLKDWMSK